MRGLRVECDGVGFEMESCLYVNKLLSCSLLNLWAAVVIKQELLTRCKVITRDFFTCAAFEKPDR